MTSSLIPDPLQMWREAVTKLESNVNSLVTGSMDSQEVDALAAPALDRLARSCSRRSRRRSAAISRKVNLPSRKDVSELAAALQRIEDKLDRLLPAGARRPRCRGRRAPVGRRPKNSGAAGQGGGCRPGGCAGQANDRTRRPQELMRWPPPTTTETAPPTRR